MFSFPILTVNDLVNAGEAAIQTGPFGTQLAASEYVHDGIPVINVRNIGFGRIREADLEFLNESKAYELRKHQLTVGDIVFGRKGAVERHVLIDQHADGWIQGSDCLRLRLRGKRVHPRFLSYFFTTKAHQDWMQALCSFGATMSSLNQNIVKRISFPCPALETQRKIAGILSAYDDLIETNRRRIAILERMAEELYREWFVRMRFPGYQNTKFVKGVPEGWDVKPLKSILAEIKSGIKKSELSKETLYVGLEHIPRHSLLLNDWSTGDSVDSNKLRFEIRDILFSKIRPYLHKIVLAHVSGACSTDTIVLRPKERRQEGFALMTVSSDTFVELATIASKGTKMPRADWGFLKEQNITIPSDACLEQFQHRFDMLFTQMVKLLQSNDLLNQAKCMKLSGLISGKVNVEKLKIQLPSGMASKDRSNDVFFSEELAHA